MPHDNKNDAHLPIPGVTASGSAYRATATGDNHEWRCAHVHFTQQSARTCATRRVAEVALALQGGHVAFATAPATPTQLQSGEAMG